MDAGLALVPGHGEMIVAGLAVVPIASACAPRSSSRSRWRFSVARLPRRRRSPRTRTASALLIVAFVLLGIGIGAAETVSNELILASAPPEKAGAASAVSETAYELGAVLGTTILGGILTAFYRA